MTPAPALADLLPACLEARADLLDPAHASAVRLFNGFTEGCPSLAIDLFARTLVLQDFSPDPLAGKALARTACDLLIPRLPWVNAALWKPRRATRQGSTAEYIFGTHADDRIRENGVWYAIDLALHQDSTFYLDTRLLRRWLLDNLGGRTVLNTFAYTGSLGAAALAGGAARVVQTDLDRAFLNLAKTTCTLNGFPVRRGDFLRGDFFSVVSRLKRDDQSFDCVILDPPFFSSTPGGTLDLNRDSARLINKVRPLVRDGGWLVAVNNALYVSGAEYMRTLEALCADGYLAIETLIPVPEDTAGFPSTRVFPSPSLADPHSPIPNPQSEIFTAPFNHSTKIVLLRLRRKP